MVRLSALKYVLPASASAALHSIATITFSQMLLLM
jgi:hypothetical protein